jgi:uncharacterized protein with NRDE domain
MCLILVAWQSHPDFPLVVLANRDEFTARRTRPAAWWGQSVSLLAGRDEEAGGTWLGINRQGRVAMLTNVRAPESQGSRNPSRGLIVLSALQQAAPFDDWAREHERLATGYNGFNLLVGEPLPAPVRGVEARLSYFTNRRSAAYPSWQSALAPGIYGLSNASLDTPWPKVTRAVSAFACQLACGVAEGSLLRIMADREIARERELPNTGIPHDWERALSAVHVRANGYGTRATTLLTVRRDGSVLFLERSFDGEAPHGHLDRRFEFVIDGTGQRAAALGAPRIGETD